MTDIQGDVSAGNNIVLSSDVGESTKEISTTSTSDIVVTGTGVTTPAIQGAKFICYADSNGNYRLNFNIRCTVNSASRNNINIAFAGSYPVTFSDDSNYYQHVSASTELPATNTEGYTNPNTANITLFHAAGTTTTTYSCSGDVSLKEKPTWFDDNAESTAVKNSIPLADDTDAGLLSYYKEGTFTPNIVGFGGSGSVAITGRYTRIGRLVTVDIYSNANLTGFTGEARITDLPFTSSSSTFNATGSMWAYDAGFKTNLPVASLVPTVAPNTNYINFLEASSTSVANWATPLSSAFLRLSITYTF